MIVSLSYKTTNAVCTSCPRCNSIECNNELASQIFIADSFKGRVQKKKLWKSGQENVKISRQVAIFGVILSFYNGQKWVKIFTNRSGQAEGGWPPLPPQSGQPDRFFPVFFWTLPLVIFTFFRLTLTPKGWCPSWWPEVMIETILKKRISFLWRCGEAYQKFKLFIWPQKVICIFQSIERLFLLWKQFFRKPFRGCFKRSNRTGKVFERLNKC